MSRRRSRRASRNSRKPPKSGGSKEQNKLSEKVLNFLQKNPNETYSQRQIGAKIAPTDKVALRKLPSSLQKLVNKGRIEQLSNGNFKVLSRESIKGRVDHVNVRFCYVVISDLENDIWVKQSNMKGAIHDDIVEVEIYKGQRHGLRPEGVINRILERTKTEYVGKFTQSGSFGVVEPDNKKIYFDILVKPEHMNKAKSDDKVVVEIDQWPSKHKTSFGIVREILGKTGEHEAEIHSIMAEFNLPFRFDTNVEDLAERLLGKISKEEISKRKDFRDVNTFTIDPDDAKDFDDALSIKELENGHFEVGVHIADVSHYVTEGSVIDKEAKKRATSVYLVDRTIPMLPERLSNNLCSLRPKEDKLTYSAVFEIDLQGKVYNEWFGKTIIHSNNRFTYDQAQAIIEESDKKSEYVWEVLTLNQIAQSLQKTRFKNGAINFETQEYRFQLDEEGVPLSLTAKVRKEAHKLVEDFMLLANRKVAEFVANKLRNEKERTFVYRTHDLPDPEKLMSFSIFARKFGHDFSLDRGGIAQSLNSLISDIEGKPEENVLQILAIRSMAKAVYTTAEKGHFGLSFDHYTHFTSPIRRYPDLLVHRLLSIYLHDGKSPERGEYEEMCKHSSEMEKNASGAERASIKYKQVEYMSQFLGEEFEGIISGITEWGLFVEIIETRCEGMVRISEISDDQYSFDEQNYRLVGLYNKRIFTLGDHVTVQVVKTDIDHRTMDLDLIVEDE